LTAGNPTSAPDHQPPLTTQKFPTSERRSRKDSGHPTLSLLCPICHGQMRIIAFINDADTVTKILDHIGESTRPPRIPPSAWAAAVGGGGSGQPIAHRGSTWISASPSNCRQVQNTMSRRSSGRDSARGTIEEEFLQVVTYAERKSAIDGNTRCQRYLTRARWISCP
jgi:hypothetical protein